MAFTLKSPSVSARRVLPGGEKKEALREYFPVGKLPGRAILAMISPVAPGRRETSRGGMARRRPSGRERELLIWSVSWVLLVSLKTRLWSFPGSRERSLVMSSTARESPGDAPEAHNPERKRKISSVYFRMSEVDGHVGAKDEVFIAVGHKNAGIASRRQGRQVKGEPGRRSRIDALTVKLEYPL